jgi:hypothetical protein
VDLTRAIRAMSSLEIGGGGGVRGVSDGCVKRDSPDMAKSFRPLAGHRPAARGLREGAPAKTTTAVRLEQGEAPPPEGSDSERSQLGGAKHQTVSLRSTSLALAQYPLAGA